MKSFASSEMPVHLGIGNVNCAFITCNAQISNYAHKQVWLTFSIELEAIWEWWEPAERDVCNYSQTPDINLD